MGLLNKPPPLLLESFQFLESRHRLKGSVIIAHVAEKLTERGVVAVEFGYPGRKQDMLFAAKYPHQGEDWCTACYRSKMETSPVRGGGARVRYGTIASSDLEIENGTMRNRIAQKEGVLCFESEACGLMDTFPCIMVRGVCEYADSHKNTKWQQYAAAMAIYFCKERLLELEPRKLKESDQA